MERVEDEAAPVSYLDSQILSVRDHRKLISQDLAGEPDRHFVGLPMIGQIMPDTFFITRFLAVGRHNSRYQSLIRSLVIRSCEASNDIWPWRDSSLPPQISIIDLLRKNIWRASPLLAGDVRFDQRRVAGAIAFNETNEMAYLKRRLQDEQDAGEQATDNQARTIHQHLADHFAQWIDTFGLGTATKSDASEKRDRRSGWQ